MNIEVLKWANGNISVERINQEPSLTLEELRKSKFHFRKEEVEGKRKDLCAGRKKGVLEFSH